MITVHIPALLRDLAGGAEQVRLELAGDERISVRQLLARLNAQYPGMMEALLYEGDLLPGIAVFIDNDQALLGLQAKVGAESDVHFLPPVVGGR